jgi:hypothetical protein
LFVVWAAGEGGPFFLAGRSLGLAGRRPVVQSVSSFAQAMSKIALIYARTD